MTRYSLIFLPLYSKSSAFHAQIQSGDSVPRHSVFGAHLFSHSISWPQTFRETAAAVADGSGFAPAAIYFPVVWVWDMSLSALVLTLALWLCYKIENRDDLKSWSLLGLVWGFAVLSTPLSCPSFRPHWRSFCTPDVLVVQHGSNLVAWALLAFAIPSSVDAAESHGQCSNRLDSGLA